MNLDIIEKHVHLTPLANGNLEVMFGGQPCLSVNESYGDGYTWKINPLFAKLTYGANIFEDVPYCYNSFDTVEEAIAEGLSSLNDLGAFHGVVDLPADTYTEEHLDESLDEAVTHKELLAGAQKAYIEATRQGNGVMAKHYGAQILKHKANVAKQMAAAKAARLKNESVEELDERADREDDEGYARTKNADDAHNAKIDFKKKYKPAPRKTPEQEKAEWDKWVKECITDDCRKEALKHSDSIMEAQDLARGLLESVMDELDEGSFNDSLKARASTLVKKLNKQKLHKLTVRPVAGTDKDLLGKVGEFGEKNDLSKDEHYNKALSDAHEYGKNKFAGKYEITHEDQRGQKIRGGSLAKVRKEMNESLDEAALSGDAYWKAKEEAAKEAKAKEERASMGIKEPVKKGRGKPTNIDLEFVHAAAKKNLEGGKRPTTGMDRNEKIHFVRHLSKHPDFADHHVAKAGRPTGTTAVAKVEKEKVKKAETSAFSMWAGLGKK